ncbi:DUF1294 domain-containing protein [Parablastomonas sp. CN1-191]|uniref:DUF1294 domain-containing protein n=1 Tax=Parablastomonas sp. CN1-191 TaxID=3400908 RepID=UPI003BF788BB
MVREPSILEQLETAGHFAAATLRRADPLYVLYALIAVNLIAFAAFGIDKSAAERGRWRVSEGALLRWAWLGGTLGAYAGRRAFRHKTRKQPFCARLHTIAAAQVLAGVGVVGWAVYR